jgi:hypothetical protein
MVKLHGEVAPFGAIWTGRFTAPKVLGSMVRNEKALALQPNL